MKKGIFIGLALVLLVSIPSLSRAQALSVTNLQAELKAKGARWQAGETSMTRLSPEEQKKRLGLLPLSPSMGLDAQSLPHGSLSTVALPPTLDWRNNGGNYVTSAKSQSGCGSCWAFGATAGLESAILRYRQTPNVDLDLSEQVLLSCSGNVGNCTVGGSPELASTFFMQSGLPPESCYPYTATDGSCAAACPGWQASAHKVSNWISFGTVTSVDTMKSALYTYGPLPSGLAVYQDFFPYTSGIYHHVSGQLIGGHEILIVGYDDASQCFIAKNSWGTGWGEQGFFRIAYSELTSLTRFGMDTIGYEMLDHSCPLTVTLDQSGTFSGSGAQGSVSVTTDSDCSWAALTLTDPANLRITAGAMGKGSGTVSFSLGNNTTGYPRTLGVKVRDQDALMWQDQQGCTYALNPAQASFGSAGGSASMGVTLGQSCGWMASSNATWITITHGWIGTGNATVNYTVAANTSGSQRTGTLTIAGRPFTVTQAGTGSCTYSITPTSNSLGATGGSSSVNVTAGAGCSWSATSGANWITVTSNASGSGNGSVNYSVAANTTSSQRTGTMTIANQTFTVTQAGASTCTYAITPTSQNFTTSNSATGTVNVTAGNGCSWTAGSSAAWITISSGANGSGNGSVNYSVAANTTTSQRAGTMTIANQTFTVTQAGQTCSYSITPTSTSLGASGGSGSVTVTGGTGCPWSASSSANWITISSGSTGSGNGTVGYSVAANTTSSQRTGTMTIANQSFTVTQAGQAGCSYTINPTSQNGNAAAGTASVAVTAGSGCSWTATSYASWITITSGGNGSGNGTVNYSFQANTSTTSRTGYVLFSNPSVGYYQYLNVIQAGQTACTYTISPTANSLGASGGSGSVSVTAGTGCSWSAAGNAGWITVTSGADGSGNGTVSYSVAANTTTSQRTGTMTIAGQTFTVTQAGQTACTYTLSPTSQNFSTTGGTGTFNVTARSTCSWTATSNASWITISQGVRASGNGSVNYSVAANTGASRTGTITVADKTFTVTQDGVSPCTYAITPTSNSLGASGGSGSVSVAAGSGCSWTASSGVNWITITSGNSGSGNGTMNYSVAANSGVSRNGTLSIGGKTFTVTQAGTAPTCSVSLNYWIFNMGYFTQQASFKVAAASGCSWTASANVPWIKFTSGATGTGNGTVTFTTDTNTGSARSGTISVNGSTITVNQGGAPGK